jgi:hypothetical protein
MLRRRLREMKPKESENDRLSFIQVQSFPFSDCFYSATVPTFIPKLVDGICAEKSSVVDDARRHSTAGLPDSSSRNKPKWENITNDQTIYQVAIK